MAGARIDGLDQLVQDLGYLGANVGDVRRAFRPLVPRAVAATRRRIPMGPTGRLKRSVRGSVSRSKLVVFAGEGDAFYGRFTNYGTTHQTAQNWAAKASAEMTPQAVAALETTIDEMIREVGLA